MFNFNFRSFLGGSRDEQLPVRRKACDAPGCGGLGEFKAPKSRSSIRDYFWFCLDHVREYNQNWDYFKGMTPGEVEQHMRQTVVGDRPTWRMTEAGLYEERLRQKIYSHFAKGEGVGGRFSFTDAGDDDEETARGKSRIDAGGMSHPTLEALKTMGLTPPVVWDDIKTQYKKLAKQHHPDRNQNDPASEEELKKINIAYSILKLSYQTYTDLKEKDK